MDHVTKFDMSSSKKRFERAPERTALSEGRRAKKIKNAVVDTTDVKILDRKWIPIQNPVHGLQRIKVLTWNVCPCTFIPPIISQGSLHPPSY